MSNLEICDALFADRPKLQIRAKSLIPKMAKQFKKERTFPAWKWAEYTHQTSRNRYLISFCAPTAAQVDNPIIDFIAFMEEDHQKIVIQWGCWPYRKSGSMKLIGLRAVSYYCPHFFARYRDRFWKDLDISYNELLCRYFSRNKINIPLEMNEEIQRNYRKYGDLAAVSFKQPDGVSFIRHWCEGDELSIGTDNCDAIAVVLYMTFVTHSMMTKIQNKAIGKEGEKYLQDYCKKLLEDAMKDEVFRRLNEKNLK